MSVFCSNCKHGTEIPHPALIVKGCFYCSGKEPSILVSGNPGICPNYEEGRLMVLGVRLVDAGGFLLGLITVALATGFVVCFLLGI